MDKKISAKLSALDPRFKKQIEEMFASMNKSVSLLYEAATHDEKTGLYNNKFFETVLDMEIEKAKRGHQKLCLFIIDIDFFKKINDTHGHNLENLMLLRDLVERNLLYFCLKQIWKKQNPLPQD